MKKVEPVTLVVLLLPTWEAHAEPPGGPRLPVLTSSTAAPIDLQLARAPDAAPESTSISEVLAFMLGGGAIFALGYVPALQVEHDALRIPVIGPLVALTDVVPICRDVDFDSSPKARETADLTRFACFSVDMALILTALASTGLQVAGFAGVITGLMELPKVSPVVTPEGHVGGAVQFRF